MPSNRTKCEVPVTNLLRKRLMGNIPSMRRIPVLTFLFFLTATGISQTVREIPGIVVGSVSGEALAGASIAFYYQQQVAGLIANKEGKFSIPAGTYYDSIKVSMVGHDSKVYPAHSIDGVTRLNIKLVMISAALQEVVVRPVTALDIIKKTITKIPVNQPSENFENKGFYREIIRDRKNYFSVAEAVFLAQYFPADKDYKLKLEQGRSKEDVSVTRLFEDFHPGGGPQAVAGNSFIIRRPEFLDLKEIKNFSYHIDSLIWFDGRWLYQISFDQKPGIKKALEKGYVLIDTEDDAVVQYNVQNSPLGEPYIKSLTGADKIVAEILKIDFTRKGWKRRVDFSRVKDKWVLSHAETEYAIAYKQPKKELDLDLTISIELAFTELFRNIGQSISKGEEWKKKNIIANLPTAFDSAFWGHNNIISPTEQVKNIMEAISKANREVPAETAAAGWQMMNRNLFISYNRQDTTTLIPVMRCNWEDETTGGYLFRETDSNFSIESKITIARYSDKNNLPDRGFQQAGLMVRSTEAGKENYVLLTMGTGGNPNPKLFLKKTVDNKSRTVVDKRETMNGWMRVEKSGSKITAFFKDENATTYEKTGEYNFDWLTGKVQLGLAVFAAFSGDGPKMKPDMIVYFTQLRIDNF